VWLDRGEDELLTRPVTELPPELIARVAALAVSHQVDLSAPLDCPRCHTSMGRERYAGSEVEIDRCTCGVWLDRGELEKISLYRARCLEQLGNAPGAAEDDQEPGVDLSFSPEVLERSFARIYFDLGRSE